MLSKHHQIFPSKVIKDMYRDSKENLYVDLRITAPSDSTNQHYIKNKDPKQKNVFYVSGKLAHDLRYTNDTDVISLVVMDNNRVVTAHKDLNIVCWDILGGMTIKSILFLFRAIFSSVSKVICVYFCFSLPLIRKTRATSATNQR